MSPVSEASAAAERGPHRPSTLVLTAGAQSPLALLRGTWRAREMILVLGRQDFQVRYRRASLGMLWAVGLPLVQAAVLALIFTRLVRFQTALPYLTFIFVGLVGWSFFSGTVLSASTAIVDGAGMANKIYFPRAALPLVRVVAALVGLGISVALAVVIGLFQGVRPGPALALAVPALLLTVLLTTLLSLFTAALHVYFRDVRFIVQAALSVWFYATPVFYPVSALRGPLRTLLLLNPVTAVVEMLRASLGGADPGWEVSLLPLALFVALLVAATVWMYSRYDRLFADRM